MMAKKNDSVSLLTKTAILLALALIFQIGLASLAQPVVGPLVNMVLILAVLTTHPGSAVLIGCMTPMAAFMLGIMPLFPVIPVIMMGNISLVLVFSMLKKNVWLAVVLAAITKFLVMAGLIRILATFFIPGLPAPILAAMTFPQFFTALLGGFLAVVIDKRLPWKILS